MMMNDEECHVNYEITSKHSESDANEKKKHPHPAYKLGEKRAKHVRVRK